jgi:hypothetical protein
MQIQLHCSKCCASYTPSSTSTSLSTVSLTAKLLLIRCNHSQASGTQSCDSSTKLPFFSWVDVAAYLVEPGASKLQIVNLGGTGIEIVPAEVISKHSNVKEIRLVLDGCEKLLSLPLSLHLLKSISAKDCPALVYPPKSALGSSESTMRFLKRIKESSVMWKRIKVRAAAVISASPGIMFLSFLNLV